MTKDEARQELNYISYGTWGAMIGEKEYSKIDDFVYAMLQKIDEVDVSKCKIWYDVYNAVNGGWELKEKEEI